MTIRVNRHQNNQLFYISRYVSVIQKLGYGFLFAFYANYGHIFGAEQALALTTIGCI